MDAEISYLMHEFDKNDALDEQLFTTAIKAIDCKFPPGYQEFMREHNGGEGSILDGQWLVLWPVEELQKNNEMYNVPEFAPGLFLIGSNGGGLAFGINKSKETFIQVDMYAIADEEAEDIGTNFKEFLTSLTKFADGTDGYEE
ncbi:SMI1/KNR4 family protein [Chitinophaga filiformis]|uniref:SMI1 / KNR4 family (SUKH-1) n=1 Tax=Chitinophaga filiformis TaxID=104663 RepID=A0A1G7MJ31_CHIFI|nr:SMI1/KNR4 family protein [Chitinophaga filiformis]SDF61120.1 SMI1 / KNR4 family (SUKH-1) [Chitinophaga filiformis]